MPVTLDQSRTQCVISLSGAVDIRCAAELKNVLVEALSLKRGLHVDLTGVTEVDVTALQLLWAAELEARASGTELTLDRAMPDAVVATLDHACLKFPMGPA